MLLAIIEVFCTVYMAVQSPVIVHSFRDMAKKGFVSMDRTDWINPESNDYHVVCCPNSIIPANPEGLVIKNSCIIQIEALELNSETIDVKLLDLFHANNQ